MTVITDSVFAESPWARAVLRQVIVYASCVRVRIEFIRAAGSSTETWWNEVKAKSGQSVIARRGGRAVILDRESYDTVEHGYHLEILGGPDVMMREGGRADEHRYTADYVLEMPDPIQDCVLEVTWEGVGIHQAQLVIPGEAIKFGLSGR